MTKIEDDQYNALSFRAVPRRLHGIVIFIDMLTQNVRIKIATFIFVKTVIHVTAEIGSNFLRVDLDKFVLLF